jgi:hypothetical protein
MTLTPHDMTLTSHLSPLAPHHGVHPAAAGVPGAAASRGGSPRGGRRREATPAAHRRMERGGHGLPKVSLGPAMPDPSMPCWRATPETALRPFQGWPARRTGGLRLSSTPMDTLCRTPMQPPKTEAEEAWLQGQRTPWGSPGLAHYGLKCRHLLGKFH